MNLSLINPYIRLTMESRLSAGRNIARRIIYDYELIYIEEGSFTFVYDDKAYHSKAGDIIFIRPGIPHSFILDQGDISQPHIHFDVTHRPQSEVIPISFKDFEKMSETERAWIHKDHFASYDRVPFLNISNKKEFLEIFYKIVTGSLDSLIKKALLITLISIIVNDNFPKLLQDDKQPNVVYQIKDYIDAGNGLKMTLDDFAKSFFYDKFYLERKFKEAFGASLIEYRNKKRMELAKYLLKQHSVSQVSELVGYESIYSFSRAYKSHFGYPPGNRKKID